MMHEGTLKVTKPGGGGSLDASSIDSSGRQPFATTIAIARTVTARHYRGNFVVLCTNKYQIVN
jgi:hypothetical protein